MSELRTALCVLLAALCATGCFTSVALLNMTRDSEITQVRVRKATGAHENPTLDWEIVYWREDLAGAEGRKHHASGRWVPEIECGELFTYRPSRGVEALDGQFVGLLRADGRGASPPSASALRQVRDTTEPCFVSASADEGGYAGLLAVHKGDGRPLAQLQLREHEQIRRPSTWVWLGVAVLADAALIYGLSTIEGPALGGGVLAGGC